jgi:hypothetical protein
MTELTEGQAKLLRFWGANMTIAFQTSDRWPGFFYTPSEKARLAALGDTVPPAAMALWMYALVPAIFIAIAGLAVVGLMLPAIMLLYPNPADLQVLPFVLILAAVAAVSIGLGLPVAMALGGRLALRLVGDTGGNAAAPGDTELYAKFRRQLFRYALVACGLFIPGCWLWIVYDLHAGPLLMVIKWVLAAWIAGSGFILWRLRRS